MADEKSELITSKFLDVIRRGDIQAIKEMTTKFPQLTYKRVGKFRNIIEYVIEEGSGDKVEILRTILKIRSSNLYFYSKVPPPVDLNDLFFYAITYQDKDVAFELVKTLLDKEIGFGLPKSLKRKDSDPVVNAIKFGRQDIIQPLIDAGADLTRKDYSFGEFRADELPFISPEITDLSAAKYEAAIQPYLAARKRIKYGTASPEDHEVVEKALASNFIFQQKQALLHAIETRDMNAILPFFKNNSWFKLPLNEKNQTALDLMKHHGLLADAKAANFISAIRQGDVAAVQKMAMEFPDVTTFKLIRPIPKITGNAQNAFQFVIKEGTGDVVKMLKTLLELRKDSKVPAPKELNDLFFHAIRHQDKDIASELVKLLLDQKAGFGLPKIEQNEVDPLIVAITYGRHDIVQQLIEAGADLTRIDDSFGEFGIRADELPFISSEMIDLKASRYEAAIQPYLAARERIKNGTGSSEDQEIVDKALASNPIYQQKQILLQAIETRDIDAIKPYLKNESWLTLPLNDKSQNALDLMAHSPIFKAVQEEFYKIHGKVLINNEVDIQDSHRLSP